jgi:hypothetical protein
MIIPIAHKKDRDALEDIVNGLSELVDVERRPSVREKLGVLVSLAYAKGEIRGYEACMLASAPTERPSLSEGDSRG